MSGDAAGRMSIGGLARCAGVTVKTVRWYSDLSLVSPACRSAAGYRLYNTEALARLELVRTLREIGLDLATIKRVLARAVKLAAAAAARGAQPEEVELVHRMARLSAEERRRIIADFLDQVFAGGAADPGFEAAMRAAVPELPDKPAPAQVEAWIELAELTRDPGFRDRVKDMAGQVARWAVGGESPHEAIARAAEVILPQAGAALDRGLDPASAEAAGVLDETMTTLAALEGTADGPGFRAGLLERLEIVADAAFERYWQLLAVLDGSPGPGTNVPRLGWVIAALRARLPHHGQNGTAGEATP